MNSKLELLLSKVLKLCFSDLVVYWIIARGVYSKDTECICTNCPDSSSLAHPCHWQDRDAPHSCPPSRLPPCSSTPAGWHGWWARSHTGSHRSDDSSTPYAPLMALQDEWWKRGKEEWTHSGGRGLDGKYNFFNSVVVTHIKSWVSFGRPDL